jgi:hypothetical protein
MDFPQGLLADQQKVLSTVLHQFCLQLHTKVYLQGKVEEQMASLNKDLEDISGVFIIKINICDM